MHYTVQIEANKYLVDDFAWSTWCACHRRPFVLLTCALRTSIFGENVDVFDQWNPFSQHEWPLLFVCCQGKTHRLWRNWTEINSELNWKHSLRRKEKAGRKKQLLFAFVIYIYTSIIVFLTMFFFVKFFFISKSWSIGNRHPSLIHF